jgi:hypothetical protein
VRPPPSRDAACRAVIVCSAAQTRRAMNLRPATERSGAAPGCTRELRGRRRALPRQSPWRPGHRALARHGAPRLRPLDQSVVFDGGYRVLAGQLPFRDFAAAAGAVPNVLQAGFFALLGTTWFAYCLHAAVLDARDRGSLFRSAPTAASIRGRGLTTAGCGKR